MRHAQRIYALVAGTALTLWAVTGAQLPAAVIAHTPTAPESAPAMAQDERSLLAVADDLGTRLDVAVPAGTTRLVIQPCADSADGEFGMVYAYDAEGHELLRQRETQGIA